jgi:EAL domain-containing protein (putative c-di-GMP-specific phosphodiesterase class I)
MDILTRLRIKGFKVSIDDFGTGYSSLVELHRMPFSEMKIDKSFVMNIMEDSQSRKIADSIIDLGHNLDLTVIAEGIETKEVWKRLSETKCDVAQGYFISKPVDAEVFEYWLKEHCEKKNGKWFFKIPK